MKSKPGKSSGRAPESASALLLLPALILVAALAFRTVSITTFGTLLDEQMTQDVVTGIWHGEWSNNWKHTVSLPDYRVDLYNFSSYLYADALLAGTASELASSLSNGKPDLLFWSRLLSAVTGTLAVYLFYLVALRLCGRGTALIAMTFMAVMPLLVQDSHYARPEAFVVALTAAAYLCLVRFQAHRGRMRYLACSAFCFGLLIACKFSLIPMALVPAAFLFPIEDRRLSIRAAGVCAGCTLLGVFFGVPDAFFHPSAYWHGVEFLRNQYAGGGPPHALVDGTNSLSLVASYFGETTGYLFCLFSLAGVFVLARSRRFAWLAAIGGPVAFYLSYFSLQRVFFERNLSHIAPLMALLAAIAITALAETIPVRARTAASIALVALTAAVPLWVSGKLVFVAMRASTEQRARSYEDALVRSEQKVISIALPLLTEVQVNYAMQSAAFVDGELLARISDYHDSFTRKYLAELKRRTNAREIGYFPSVFEGYDVSTLIAYHALSFRYLLISPAPPAPGTDFVSWLRAAQPLAPGSIRLSSWVENGLPGIAVPAIDTRFYGSYTAGGDSNTGEMELGPINVQGVREIGIALITGPNCTGLSLTVLNHRTGEPIVRLSPPPVMGAWHLLRIDLSGPRPDEIDVIARDEGSGWGQWLAIGSPVTLKPI
jgi:hypothetical protein